ncbi:MAG: response regulator transcription factor [Clostridia bacterium]|nr:response regulator transcription factor [Clostridia bacterium]
MSNLLIVEDNPDLLELFYEVLSESGYNVFGASDGLKALEKMEQQKIDLLIADLMMPNLSGQELVKIVRKTDKTLPILIVTARDDYESMQTVFSTGADDYMIKPVNTKELLLRVKALLRRAKINAEQKVQVGSTILDSESMTVFSEGKEIILPLKEFQLLFRFLSYPNKIFTRQRLMDEIWGMDSESDEKTINTHINRLRERFSDCPDFEIVTIRGLGYKAVKK